MAVEASAETRRRVGVCPRCDVCGRVVRVRGVGEAQVWCAVCLSEALPFNGIEGERDFRGALKEYREGLGSRAFEFEEARFNPFGEEEQGTMRELDRALRGCSYTMGNEMTGCLRDLGKEGGCSLSMLFLNIRSAKGPGLELLEAEMNRWGVQWDLVGLAETWLDSESEKLVSVKGFSLVSASRRGRIGGGVALLIREGLVYRERGDLSMFLEGVFESTFVEIVRGEGQGNIIVGVVYRPPGGEMGQFNSRMVEIANKLRGKEVYIMGDFNVDLLKSSSHSPSADYLEGLYATGFYPLISLPTRITDVSATLIDNIWTNNLQSKIRSGLVTVRISDHLPIFALVGGSGQRIKHQAKVGLRRSINERRILQFSEKLQAWSFDEVRAQGIDANVARFRNEFRDMYNTTFPFVKDRRSKKDQDKPWLNNDEFKGLVEEKGELYHKKIKGKLNEGGIERLKVVSKEVNQMRQQLKRAYFKQRLEEVKGDLKSVWEVLGEALRGSRNVKGGAACGYFEKDGVGITDGNKIANGFCDFYCKVGPNLASRFNHVRDGAFMQFMGEEVNENLYWRPATPWEVEELLVGLESGKAAGWDEISPKVVKRVARELSGPLSRLYNACMREGHYPACFKVARVVPIFKSEDPTQFSNYRPVSVLPVLSQVFERVLKRRLVEFFDRHSVIIPGQYGFRNGHSTAMAILDMVEKVRLAWIEKKVALGVFVDLKKAFDTVDHEILLRKLDHCGVRGATLRLMASYLADRTQYVCYGGIESDKGQVKCGVPQGSVLGPLFFLIFVNDMVRASKDLEFVLFADDTNIFVKGRNFAELIEKVNRGLAELSKWFSCNKLTLNLKKTEYIYFGGQGCKLGPAGEVKIGGEPITRPDTRHKMRSRSYW